MSYNGAAVTLIIAGLIASFIGALSYHQMKDRPNVSLWSDISNAIKGELGKQAEVKRIAHKALEFCEKHAPNSELFSMAQKLSN